MILVIKNPPVEYTQEFYNFLIDRIRLMGITSIERRKLVAIDDFINTKYKSILKKRLSSYEALCSFFDNLTITKHWDKVIIGVDPNKIIPNTNAKLINVVKLITYGNLNLRGYDLILKIFKQVEENIEAYFELYQRGL